MPTDMTLHQVRDATKILKFQGKLIGNSTSYRRGSSRWVEFKLYKTKSGAYVLSRLGVSMLFHDPECEVVERNHLDTVPLASLDRHFVPCHLCTPDRYDLDEVCPEKPRPWAMVSETPDGIIAALEKEDENGARYTTLVAQRLLEQACDVDPVMDAAYRVEFIP